MPKARKHKEETITPRYAGQVARLILEKRLETGASQSHLGRLLGFTSAQSTIGGVERGFWAIKIKGPREHRILATHLGISDDELTQMLLEDVASRKASRKARRVQTPTPQIQLDKSPKVTKARKSDCGELSYMKVNARYIGQVARLLSDTREALGHSQKEVAERVFGITDGTDLSFMTSRENGWRPLRPTRIQTALLAAYLNLSIPDLRQKLREDEQGRKRLLKGNSEKRARHAQRHTPRGVKYVSGGANSKHPNLYVGQVARLISGTRKKSGLRQEDIAFLFGLAKNDPRGRAAVSSCERGLSPVAPTDAQKGPMAKYLGISVQELDQKLQEDDLGLESFLRQRIKSPEVPPVQVQTQGSSTVGAHLPEGKIVYPSDIRKQLCDLTLVQQNVVAKVFFGVTDGTGLRFMTLPEYRPLRPVKGQVEPMATYLGLSYGDLCQKLGEDERERKRFLRENGRHTRRRPVAYSVNLKIGSPVPALGLPAKSPALRDLAKLLRVRSGERFAAGDTEGATILRAEAELLEEA
jgi:transcriptional regulator with XRE-family HTH domain